MSFKESEKQEWSNQCLSPLEHMFFGSSLVYGNSRENILRLANGGDENLKLLTPKIQLDDKSTNREGVESVRRKGMLIHPMWVFGPSAVKDTNLKYNIRYYDDFGLNKEGHVQGFRVEFVNEANKPILMDHRVLMECFKKQDPDISILFQLFEKKKILVDSEDKPILDGQVQNSGEKKTVMSFSFNFNGGK